MSSLIQSAVLLEDLSPGGLRRQLMLEFGIAGQAAVLAAARRCGEIKDHFLSSGAECNWMEWRRAVAEELLLLDAQGNAIPRDVAAEFATVSPFSPIGGPVLGDCLGNSAVVVFPLAGQEEPGIGHVWVVRGLPHRDSAQGADSVIPPQYGLCFAVSHRDWSGSSWQLAGAMALAIIRRDPAAPKQVDLLDWVMSGCIAGDRITKVAGLSSKGALPLANKRWLLSRENAVDDDLKLMRRRLRMVYTESSLRSAMALVTGQGTRFHKRDANRIECDEMHALIGGAPEPVIAGFLLSTTNSLVLWHSGKTKSIATLIGEVVSSLLPNADVDTRIMSSDSIVKAEQTLWEPMRDKVARRVAINITGGNRLMSYAAHTMAKLYDNIVLVYRDTDAPPHEFFEIVYRQDNASEGKLACQPHRCASRRWDVLYTNNSKRNLSAQDILNEMTR